MQWRSQNIRQCLNSHFHFQIFENFNYFALQLILLFDCYRACFNANLKFKTFFQKT